MFETMPVQLTAFYTVNEIEAVVRFAGDSDASVYLTIIQYDSYYEQAELPSSQFRGDEASSRIAVRDGDVLVLLAKRKTAIVASQVYEVDLSMPLTTGMLLIPRAGYNVICQQEFMTEEQLAGLKVNRLTINGPMLGGKDCGYQAKRRTASLV